MTLVTTTSLAALTEQLVIERKRLEEAGERIRELEHDGEVARALVLNAISWIEERHSDRCPFHFGQACRCGAIALANDLGQRLAQG